MYFVTLPIYLISPSKIKKTWSINLNVYRNTNSMVLGNYKKLFHLEVAPLIKELPLMNKITLDYVLYPKSTREIDIANVLTIVDKFFCDVLVSEGKIPNDSFKYIKKITFSYGEPLPQNPHALCLITPI